MKKVFLMVVVAMMTAMSVNAQSNEPRHEIGLSYGLGASAVFDKELYRGRRIFHRGRNLKCGWVYAGI